MLTSTYATPATQTSPSFSLIDLMLRIFLSLAPLLLATASQARCTAVSAPSNCSSSPPSYAGRSGTCGPRCTAASVPAPAGPRA